MQLRYPAYSAWRTLGEIVGLVVLLAVIVTAAWVVLLRSPSSDSASLACRTAVERQLKTTVAFPANAGVFPKGAGHVTVGRVDDRNYVCTTDAQGRVIGTPYVG